MQSIAIRLQHARISLNFYRNFARTKCSESKVIGIIRYGSIYVLIRCTLTVNLVLSKCNVRSIYVCVHSSEVGKLDFKNPIDLFQLQRVLYGVCSGVLYSGIPKGKFVPLSKSW